ncbi:hypothetical protein JHW43_002756 [Diplocarpon mali]|nr:hypothetical protein JHW43_002756 [Diplocarpon mali]
MAHDGTISGPTRSTAIDVVATASAFGAQGSGTRAAIQTLDYAGPANPLRVRSQQRSIPQPSWTWTARSQFTTPRTSWGYAAGEGGYMAGSGTATLQVAAITRAPSESRQASACLLPHSLISPVLLHLHVATGAADEDRPRSTDALAHATLPRRRHSLDRMTFIAGITAVTCQTRAPVRHSSDLGPYLSPFPAPFPRLCDMLLQA